MKRTVHSQSATAFVPSRTASTGAPPATRKKASARSGNRESNPTKVRHNGGLDDDFDAEQVLGALMAVKKGDFGARLPVAWNGIAGKVADAFNEVTEMMSRSTVELSRISRVVGKEGKIQERLSMGSATGAWSERVNSVNTLIDCLAHPISETARVIGAVAKGDLSQNMALEIDGSALEGEFLRTAKTVNTMVSQLGAFASEVNRVAREVGTEGKLGGQAKVKGVAGTWKEIGRAHV